MEGLSRAGHLQEDAEDIERQQGDDDDGNGLLDQSLQFVGQVLHAGQVQVSHSQASDERKHEGAHHVHERWDGQSEIGGNACRLVLDLLEGTRGGQQMGEHGSRNAIGKESGEDG